MKNNLRKLNDFILISNLSFLPSVVLLLIYKQYIYACILLSSLFFSHLHHLHKEKHYKKMDNLFSFILILTNLYSFNVTNFSTINFYIAVICSILAFYFYFKAKKDYSLNHGFWHIFSGVITLLAVLNIIKVPYVVH